VQRVFTANFFCRNFAWKMSPVAKNSRFLIEVLATANKRKYFTLRNSAHSERFSKHFCENREDRTMISRTVAQPSPPRSSSSSSSSLSFICHTILSNNDESRRKSPGDKPPGENLTRKVYFTDFFIFIIIAMRMIFDVILHRLYN